MNVNDMAHLAIISCAANCAQGVLSRQENENMEHSARALKWAMKVIGFESARISEEGKRETKNIPWNNYILIGCGGVAGPISDREVLIAAETLIPQLVHNFSDRSLNGWLNDFEEGR